jgi:hypothetical protein
MQPPLAAHRVPCAIYAATAIFCWFAPSSIDAGERYRIINVAPTGSLAAASAALALVHWALNIVGPLAVVAAGAWAAATAILTMGFAAEVLPVALWALVPTLQTVGLAAVSFAYLVLAWQVARGRRAPAVHWLPRCVVALGIALLASVHGEIAWNEVAVQIGIASPASPGVEAVAEFLARLTISLWLCSVVLILGAVVHGIVSIARRKPASDSTNDL